MKTAILIFALLILPVHIQAQDVSMTSHKQSSATAQNVTGTGAQTALPVTGYSQVLVTLRGTYGGVGFTFQSSPDGTNYFPTDGFRRGDTAPGGIESSPSSLTNTTRHWLVNVVGMSHFRLNVTAISSGTANFTITRVAAPVTTATVSNWVNPIRADVDTIGLGDASGTRLATATTTPGGSDLGLVVRVAGSVTVGAHQVTNAGVFATQIDGSALTALQLIDNIVFTEDTATADQQSGVPIFARRTATPANQSGSDGDLEWLQISAGRLWSSANIDSINGVTPLMGSGNTGTGSLRTTMATDNSAIALWGHGVRGSAAPANAVLMGEIASGNLAAPIQCNQSAVINTSSSGSTQLVSLQSGQTIYVCSWDVIVGGTTNVTMQYGTGTNCGTGTTALTGPYPLVANFGAAPNGGNSTVFRTAASNALCVNNSAAVQISGRVSYTQF